ncbi:MAG: DUF835 domain-containing protein [Candidatus Thermoplasmatota archaeon]|nr:DUF835 domain-containing protein [Candidatus Thermoplasmatota archaeon]
MINHELEEQIFIFSRLSPQRLGQHIRLENIEFKWLSESMSSHSLSPSLERIHHAISTRIATDAGIIWVDAVEYLIHRQGFDAFLAFTRSLADELNGSEWVVLLPFSPLSMDGTEIAHLRREAVPFTIEQTTIPEPNDVEEIDHEEVEPEDVEVTEPEESIDEPMHSELQMLSSIAQAALTPAVLNRRIEQWVSMGFDVSDLENAIISDGDDRYSIYRDVEERVRVAIECEKRIQMIEVRGHTVEATKMRFRIMQLTGLDDVKQQLDEILQGEQV